MSKTCKGEVVQAASQDVDLVAVTSPAALSMEKSYSCSLCSFTIAFGQ